MIRRTSKMHRLRRFVLVASSCVAIFAAGASIQPIAAAEDGIPDQGFASSARIQYLKTRIAIKDGQSEAWSTYIAALEAYREAVRGERAAEVQGILGGADPVEGGAEPIFGEHPARRATAKATLKASYEALYAVLDPSQQRAADATLTAGECGK